MSGLTCRSCTALTEASSTSSNLHSDSQPVCLVMRPSDSWHRLTQCLEVSCRARCKHFMFNLSHLCSQSKSFTPTLQSGTSPSLSLSAELLYTWTFNLCEVFKCAHLKCKQARVTLKVGTRMRDGK